MNATSRSLGWGTRLLIGLVLLIAGAAAATWGLAHYQPAARFLGVTQPQAPATPKPIPLTEPSLAAMQEAAPAAEQRRIANLEARLSRVENATERAEGSAGRADAQLQTPGAPTPAISTTPVSAGAAAPQPALVLAPGTCCLVASGSIVEISIDEPLDSKTSIIGQHFAIHLAAPLTLADGTTVIEAGMKGVGEVIHAARAHMAGKAGELLLVARYLDVNGTQVPLRGFRLGGQGKDNSTLVAATTAAIGVVGMFISGGEKRVPPGTIATAKIAVDTILPSLAPPPAPAPAPATAIAIVPAAATATASTASPLPVVSTKERQK